MRQVDFISAIANERRWAALRIIMEGEIGVGKLAERLGISQSALSQRLAILRELHLVKPRRAAHNM